MPSRDELKAQRPVFTMVLNGYFGTGKTLQAHSFQKCYTISVDPAGLETLRQPRNSKFMDNLVWYEELHNENEAGLKRLFDEKANTSKPEHRYSFYGCLAHAKELAAKGEIETLIIDGFSFLCDLIWQKICEFEEVRSEKTGNRDSQAMYRALGLYLQRFVASDILTIATRSHVSVILTTHLKRESQEAVQGSESFKNRARKVNLNSDIAPMVEGGFRNKLEGLVGASIYLDKKVGNNGIEYSAICDIASAMSTIVMAKNRFGLPARLPLNNTTLYQAIMDSLAGRVTSTAKLVAQPQAPSPPPSVKPPVTVSK